MTTITLSLFLLLQTAGGASVDCPLHAEHMAEVAHKQSGAPPAGHQHGALARRGEDARGMGFSQSATTHHFWLHLDGGEIQITANDPADSATVSQIRAHIQRIQAQFAAGDFSIPHFVHGQDPPGVDVMKKKRSTLKYRAEDLKDGARLVITTADRQALDALHRFLIFQIREHQTGDSAKVE